VCATGQHLISGMLFISQCTWKISKLVPYSSLVLSAHKALMTSKMRLRVVSEMMLGNEEWVDCVEGERGSHKRSLSLARQCGWFAEGSGWRLGAYGHSLYSMVSFEGARLGDGKGKSKQEGKESIVLEDVENEFVFVLGLSSGVLSFLLLGA